MANKEWLKPGVDGLTVGERLGDLIANEGITQSQLAEKTGIKQSAISEYINGKKTEPKNEPQTVQQLLHWHSIFRFLLIIS